MKVKSEWVKRLLEVAGVRKLRRHFVQTVLQANSQCQSPPFH